MNLIKKISNIIHKFIEHNYYDYCYTDREYEGIATMGCCSGMVGGTKSTEYLSESCIDCPYFVMIQHKKARDNNVG